jgi:RNA polymerase sigma-70 factor, ECF subfamily
VLLRQMRSGDSDAVNRLVPLVIDDLHRLAEHYLGAARPGHTLQPAALVNEAHLKLIGDQDRDWRSRAYFIGVTASIMRRILVDYAPAEAGIQRDAAGQALPLEEEGDWLSYEQAEEMVALNTALDRLELMNSRQRQVVELRYFGGLSPEETRGRRASL